MRDNTIAFGVRLRHYLFLSFLAFASIGSLQEASWLLVRTQQGTLTADLKDNFIALRELPAGIAVPVWVYGVVGRCTTLMLAIGMARSSQRSRVVFVRIFPSLLLAESLAVLIAARGADGLGSALSSASEYLVILLLWCAFAWPYLLSYRFYGHHSADPLFL